MVDGYGDHTIGAGSIWIGLPSDTPTTSSRQEIMDCCWTGKCRLHDSMRLFVAKVIG